MQLTIGCHKALSLVKPDLVISGHQNVAHQVHPQNTSSLQTISVVVLLGQPIITPNSSILAARLEPMRFPLFLNIIHGVMYKMALLAQLP